METADIRRKFLAFFESKAHTIVPSSPLVPGNDPTLLFTNSGMVQFKDVFLGYDKRPYTTAVTAQRCLRAGGKHNDLENVGYTARHHTFFEMLGNFSFGEYFKEKAIPYAWEFLTGSDWLNLKKEHLWITVFGGGHLFGDGHPAIPADTQARELWKSVLLAAGFDEAEAERRIINIPTTDNFWMMGNTGPCGPCSEIFYDKDAAAKTFRGEDEATADDCVEIWNLVFMQYNRDDNGTLHDLPAPCIDTGMGLERISAVLQNTAGNYETDLFKTLIRAVAAMTQSSEPTPSHRVISDHIRSAAFLIADGVLPDNEGRGYVLRRIIRRALRHLQKIQPCEQPRFYQLVATLVDCMGDAYPELVEHREAIATALMREEEGFTVLLKNGMAILDGEIKKRGKANAAQPLAGDVVFKLYDTYGFPPDMTANIARDDYGIGIDEAGFDACMQQQRERSRRAMKFNIGQSVIPYDGADTDFLGYSEHSADAVVLAIFQNDRAVKHAEAGSNALVILDRTPFYAESGGQVADVGSIKSADAVVRVLDTQKIRKNVWGHWTEIENGTLQVGDQVHCAIDADYRRDITRAHSAAHLLHAALRQVLGKHVQQRGSRVADDQIRFDFSHNAAMTADELQQVETMVNRHIIANHNVQTQKMPLEDALKSGAMALFGEKYGEVVRVVTMNPDFSVELCGGTHVNHCGEIGLFQFVAESAIAVGVRRVEAVSAMGALQQAQHNKQRLADLAQSLKTPTNRLEEKIANMQDTLHSNRKQIEALQTAQAQATIRQLAGQATRHSTHNINIVIAQAPDTNVKLLRNMANQLCARLSPAAVLLACEDNGKAHFAAATDSDKINAQQWLATAAAAAGAKGGGKPTQAQAGGGTPAQIPQALKTAQETL